MNSKYTHRNTLLFSYSINYPSYYLISIVLIIIFQPIYSTFFRHLTIKSEYFSSQQQFFKIFAYSAMTPIKIIPKFEQQ